MEIPYRLGESSLCDGLGLFASEDIPKGTLIWRYKRDLWGSKEFSCKEDFLEFLNTQEPELKETILHHSVYNAKKAWGAQNDIVWLFEEGTYCNHSDHANVVLENRGGVIATFAMRKINAGEELSENYNNSGYTSDISWVIEAYRNNGVPYFTDDYTEDLGTREDMVQTVSKSKTSDIASFSKL